MKIEKNYTQVLIVIVTAIILAGVLFFLPSGHKYDISKFPVYYRDLAKTCETTGGCCMVSLERMAYNNYTLEPVEGCHPGFTRNLLRCEGSLVWCEPQ